MLPTPTPSILVTFDAPDIIRLLHKAGFTVLSTQQPVGGLCCNALPQADAAPTVILARPHSVPDILDSEIVLLAFPEEFDDAATLLDEGASAIVPEPYSPTLLLATIRKAWDDALMRQSLRRHQENAQDAALRIADQQLHDERIVAAGHIVEGLSRAMVEAVEDARCAQYVATLPTFAALHERNDRQESGIVAANRAFRERFLPQDIAVTHSLLATKAGHPRPTGIEYLQSRDNADWISPVEETFRSGTACKRCEPILTTSGEELPALIYTFPIPGTDPTHGLALEIAVDLSTVEAQQQKLLSAQREYRRLFDESPCLITVQDRDLRIVDANRRFRDIFGFTEGLHCYAAYKHRSEPCPHCPILKTFEDGLSHEGEMQVITPRGDARNILVQTAPITDDTGTVTQVIELATDITMIRRLQDHLASLGIMLGSMSHGMKGLLMALDGGVYRVESGLRQGDMDRVASGWQQVRDRLSSLRKTALDILDYARSRDRELGMADFRVFVEDQAEAVRHKATAHGITLLVDTNAANGALEADTHALSSALTNILDSAVDACLFDPSPREHSVRLRAWRQDGLAHVEIEDNGIGLDQETRDAMFTLFFSSKGPVGTGIGLFYAHSVISSHNGRIEVDSEVGRGTRFHIQLPLRQSGAAA